MKIFNKGRKSFGNNKFRRNDRDNSYHSNDRNSKFGRKNGERKKFIKSEQLEEEDSTPWHVMKQNLKPLIAIKNPEIEDDWNCEEKRKFKAAKQEFMRQKDERHRKFLIEHERKTETKWDTFSDVDQSEGEANELENDISNESNDDHIFDIVNISIPNENVVPVKQILKKSKKNTVVSEKGSSPKETKISDKTKAIGQPLLVQENSETIHVEQPIIAKKKRKKTVHQTESLKEFVIDSEIERPIIAKKKSKKAVGHTQVLQEQVMENNPEKSALKKKKIENTSNHKVPPKVDENGKVKNKSMKTSKESQPRLDAETAVENTTLDIVPEEVLKPKKTKKLHGVEKPDQTFLEHLASQKQNEPVLLESANFTKSGPKCFACRQYGHSLKQCRDFDNTSSRICIKCGSNEHAYQNCTVHKGRVFKFASCFICKATGHISSQCKEKKNGVYPDGGNCRYCSSIEHLGLNCPRRPGRKKKRKFTKNRISRPNDKLHKRQNADARGTGSGRIQKNNKLNKNFK